MNLSMLMALFSFLVLIVLLMTSKDLKNSVLAIIWTSILMLHILRLVEAL